MSTTVTYEGNTIATVNNNTKTLQTAGKYLTDNITLVDVTQSGGITPSGTKQISISTNGTTTEDVTSYASAEIAVNVPQNAADLITKVITANGTYDAEDDSADGYSSVTVNVPHIGPQFVLIGQSTHTLEAYTGTSTAQTIDTGINIKNTDYALGLVVITCDGTKTNAADWGGFSVQLFTRYNSNSALMSSGVVWLKNNTLSRAQMTANGNTSSSYGVCVPNNTNNVTFSRKAHSTACPEVMAGTYTVKVYGITAL